MCPAHAGDVTDMHVVMACHFRMGIQSDDAPPRNSGDVQISSFRSRRPHCLPIRPARPSSPSVRNLTPETPIPSRLWNSGRGNLPGNSIHPTTDSLPAHERTSPLRPTPHEVARRGLFLSAIFRAPRKGLIRGEGGADARQMTARSRERKSPGNGTPGARHVGSHGAGGSRCR